MSYLRKIEYKIIPDESFIIIRNCSGCGCKTSFHNTNCFRVNANGRKIDVWLVYQCTKCKHTCNLTIYERLNPESISKQEYEMFLNNDPVLALRYGTDRQLFSANKMEVSWADLHYSIERDAENPDSERAAFQKDDLIVIRNIHALKVRTEKIVAEVLNVTRANLKMLCNSGAVVFTEDKRCHTVTLEIMKQIA